VNQDLMLRIFAKAMAHYFKKQTEAIFTASQEVMPDSDKKKSSISIKKSVF
jgi:hypothetical protein